MIYIDETHTYLSSEGIIIPSVSKLTTFATKDSYQDIPKSVLKNAQDYGTAVHKAIEDYLNEGKITEFSDIKKTIALEQFIKLKDKYITNDREIEVQVDYEERYGGRFDCFSGGTLMDWKTNAKAPIEKLEWQMGYYKLAMESKGIKVDKCMALWLPKGKAGKWIEITPKSKEECIKNLEEYEDEEQKNQINLNY